MLEIFARENFFHLTLYLFCFDKLHVRHKMKKTLSQEGDAPERVFQATCVRTKTKRKPKQHICVLPVCENVERGKKFVQNVLSFLFDIKYRHFLFK